MVTSNNNERNVNAINDVRRKLNEVLTKEEGKITVGWRPNYVERKEGDTWEDVDGNQWVRKQGFSEKLTKLDTAKTPWFCPECEKAMPHKFDTKFWRIRNKCMDCVIKEETEMKRLGLYELYEKENMKKNYIAAIKYKLEELEDLRDTVSSPTIIHADDTKILMVEKWNVDIDKVKKDIEEDIVSLKNALTEAETI
jgi:hypothetical protein